MFVAYIILENFLTNFMKISNCSKRYQKNVESNLNNVRFIPSATLSNISNPGELTHRARYSSVDFSVNWDTLKSRYINVCVMQIT